MQYVEEQERPRFKSKMYALDNLYVAVEKKTKKIVFLRKEGSLENPKYYKATMTQTPSEETLYSFYTEKQITSRCDKYTLEEYMEKYNIDILLYDSNLNKKETLSTQFIQYVENVIKARNMMEPSRRAIVHKISNDMAELTSDLLGINISTNPLSRFVIKEEVLSQTKEVVVSARKQKELVKYLQQFYEICLYAERNVVITKVPNGIGDYRIIRALKKAKIHLTDNLLFNSFSFVADQSYLDKNHSYIKTVKELEKSKVKTF